MTRSGVRVGFVGRSVSPDAAVNQFFASWAARQVRTRTALSTADALISMKDRLASQGLDANPVLNPSPEVIRELRRLLADLASGIDATLGPTHAASVLATEKLMTPQMGLTSMWGLREPLASPDVRIEPATCRLAEAIWSQSVQHVARLGPAVHSSFSVAKSHNGPTYSSGWPSFFAALRYSQLLERPCAQPMVSNFRHGAAQAEFDECASIIRSVYARRSALLVRYVCMVPLSQSLQRRAFSDYATSIKTSVGAGHPLVDLAFVMGHISRDQRIALALGSRTEWLKNRQPNGRDVSVPVPRRIWRVCRHGSAYTAAPTDTVIAPVLFASDFSNWDLHQGERMLRAAQDMMRRSCAAAGYPGNAAYGFNHEVTTTEYLRQRTGLRLCPPPVMDKGCGLLAWRIDRPETIVSGDPDTAALGSAAAIITCVSATAAAYGLHPDELTAVALAIGTALIPGASESARLSAGWDEILREFIFSDDFVGSAAPILLINDRAYVFNQDAYYGHITERLGVPVKREPLAILRHDVTPGFGLSKQIGRLLVRRFGPYQEGGPELLGRSGASLLLQRMAWLSALRDFLPRGGSCHELLTGDSRQRIYALARHVGGLPPDLSTWDRDLMHTSEALAATRSPQSRWREDAALALPDDPQFDAVRDALSDAGQRFSFSRLLDGPNRMSISEIGRRYPAVILVPEIDTPTYLKPRIITNKKIKTPNS